jgi:hypothetical protein
MNKQIVFVLSTNYAGSHFLALQLSSHTRCTSLGEFHRFKRRGERRRQACSICDSDEQCPVFRGLADSPVAELYDRVFANIAEMDPGIVAGIDNSKKPAWAERFLDLDGYDRRYIHLIRDPRALVRRWMLCYDSPKAKSKVRRLMARRCWRRGFSILCGSEANVYVNKWAYQNRQISRFIESNRLNATTLTYRDLVQQPEQSISAIMQWLGHEFEPDQLEYWRFQHHGSQKPQYMKKPDTPKYHDLRWKDFLDTEAQIEIEQHPQVHDYLQHMTITMRDDGLTMTQENPE